MMQKYKKKLLQDFWTEICYLCNEQNFSV